MGNKASGNKQAQGAAAKKGAHLVVSARSMILRAFDIVDERAKTKGHETPAQKLADAFENNPLKFLDTASKFIPKDIQLTDKSSKNPDDYTDDELLEIVAAKARQRREQEESKDNQQENQQVTAVK